MAHTLHVGDLEFPLYSTKITTPSINVRISNDVFYAPLVSRFIPGTMHVQYNDSVYSAPIQNTPGCSGANTHVGNYYFVGDCLVGVDDNVYLEGTGTQYIDTEVFVQRTDTISLVIDGVFFDDAGPFNGSNNFNQIVTMDGIYLVTGTSGYVPENVVMIGGRDTVSSSWDGNIGSDTLYVNDIRIGNFDVSSDHLNNICIFVICDNGLRLSNFGAAHVRVYSVKVIRDNNMFVRHMIPVPAGMVIGDYTVPENGMWDVVEQKFYGNSGTGDFVYGVDQ